MLLDNKNIPQTVVNSLTVVNHNIDKSCNTKNKFWLVIGPTWSTIQGIIEQTPVGGKFEVKSMVHACTQLQMQFNQSDLCKV